MKKIFDYEDLMCKFKNLPHLDSEMKVKKDGYYAPTLYFDDKMWHISWISSEEGDSLIDFENKGIENVIEDAWKWCQENGLKNKDTWKR